MSFILKTFAQEQSVQFLAFLRKQLLFSVKGQLARSESQTAPSKLIIEADYLRGELTIFKN